MSRPRAETIPAVTVPSNPNGVPVNKGNSGGPTFDMDGNVIGVNTAIFSPSGGSVGIAFDIPAETVKSVVAQLKDNGMVSRGWLGVQIQPVTADIAESLGMNKTEGALVTEPQAGSPAAKAGVLPGDVITAVNGNIAAPIFVIARFMRAKHNLNNAAGRSCSAERLGGVS
jgi:serine protease Do